MYDGVNEKNETKFKGYCIDLIDEIRNITKFEYDIYEAPDKVFGNHRELHLRPHLFPTHCAQDLNPFIVPKGGGTTIVPTY
jgi:hypothetical protein